MLLLLFFLIYTFIYWHSAVLFTFLFADYISLRIHVSQKIINFSLVLPLSLSFSLKVDIFVRTFP